MKKVWKWMRKYIRPHIAYKPKIGEEIDIEKDSTKEMVDNIKEQTEVGVKFTFKF